MVAKMILLAVSASAALASASARSLSQQSAFAQAYQLSLSFDDENSAEGETEADTRGETDTAYADAEGFAGYAYEAETEVGPQSGNFAVAETVAETVATNYDGIPNDPDAQSFTDSRAISNYAAGADALSESTSVGVGSLGIFGGTSALSVGNAAATGTEFGAARTVAQAYGRRDASSFAEAIGISEEYAGAEAQAQAIALNGDAVTDALAGADTFGGDEDAFAASDATADSLALRGGAAASRAQSGAFNDEDSSATSQALSVSRAFTSPPLPQVVFIPAGPASSRATSRAGGSVPVPLP